MAIDNIKAALPEYAKDTKLNLGSVTTTSSLTEAAAVGDLVGLCGGIA